jgi:hypothetical protein
MGERFKLTIIGRAKWILGMQVNFLNNGQIQIDQQKYLHDILERFGMINAKPIGTPTMPSEKKTGDEPMVDRRLYLSMIGSLIYLATVTRPDIAFATSKAGRAMADPRQPDMNAVKKIFRYLQATKEAKITYRASGNTEIIGYADADFGGDLETRRSTSGYIFLLANGAISWMSKRQSIVALSTTEAEYIACCATEQEAIYLRRLLEDLRHPVTKPTLLFQDNQGAITIERDFISNRKSKHIDIKEHFIQENRKQRNPS